MRLVRGAPGSGKTALILGEFKEALRSGRRDLRLIAPTATLVRHLQHELARDGLVFPPHSVVSLNRFIAERATPARTVVPAGLLRAIARDALGRLALPEFAQVAATGGMASVVIDTIALFENADCTPEKLIAVRKLSPAAKAFAKLWQSISDSVNDCGYSTRTQMIRAAAANSQPALVWLDGFVGFSLLECELLRSLAGSSEVTLTLTDSPASDEIRRFALQLGAHDRLLSGAPRKAGIAVIEAGTVEREADEIARRIAALHDRGMPFREMGIAVRDAESYLPLLRGTLERFDIPAHFYFGSPLKSHPVSEFLGGLISGALNGWEWEATLAALRNHPRWGASAEFDRFDFKVREAMPGRGAEALLALCERDWLREAIAECLKVDSWKKHPQPPAEWLRRFETLATALYRPGVLDLPREYNDVEAARSHVAALRSWVEAVASIASFWHAPERPIALDEFHRVAAEAIESAAIRVHDDRANTVHVMNVYEARQWDLKSLFVCGVADRDFPKRHPQNLLFPESEIERLRRAGITLRSAADQDREERWLFESLRTRAMESLFFTVPARDSSGKSVQASRLLLDLQLRVEQSPACLPVARFTRALTGRAGRVDAPGLRAEMAGLHRKISLTALEELAQCRFRFFSSKTLGLKGAPERPGERLSARLTGSIMHFALERWLIDRNRDFVEVYEEAFDEISRREGVTAGYRLEVERMKFREIAQGVRAIDRWNADSQAEVEIALDFPDGITVTGRIDRIDVFDNNDCVIVDYKSSKTASVEKLVTSRTRLQGPLYSLAVRDALHLNPVAMVYWAVRDDKPFGWGKIPGVDLALEAMPQHWADDARERTVERLSEFLAGHVQAHPEEAEQCRWCDFKNTCRVEQQTLVMIEGARSA